MEDDWNSAEGLAWERACLARVQRGELEAFGAIYDRFAPRVYTRVLLPRLRRRDLADDALAETFRRAFEKLSTFHSHDVSVYFWVARIARNVAEDAHRERARRLRALASYGTLQDADAEPTPTPEHALAAREHEEDVRTRIVACLASLHPRYRRVLELRFLEGRSRPECAELLDVKLGTLDVLVLRALRAFKAAFDAASEGHGDRRG